MIISKLKKHFVLILVVAFCLLPLFWFKGSPIAGEEYYALDYAKWGQLFSGSWFNSVNWGEYSPLSSFKLQAAFFNILYWFGLSKFISLVIWHLTLNLCIGLSFYLFVKKLYGKNIPDFVYLLGTIYYTYTPFFLNISPFLSPPKIFLALLPIIFLEILSIYISKAIKISNIFRINLVLLLASPIFVNIPLGLVLLGTTFISLFYVLLIINIPWKNRLISLLIFVGIFVFLNVWWLLPTAYKQFGQSAGLKEEAASFVTTDKTLTADVISLFGSWAFREKIANTDYYYFPFNTDYDKLLGGLSRYIPFIVILVSLYAFINSEKSKQDKNHFMFLLFTLYIVFLFLSKGVAEPFGFVYKFLYSHFPLFWIYREPYAKFLPIVSFTSSLLLIYGGGYIYEYSKAKFGIKSWPKITLIVISIIFTYVLIKPFINGTIVWDVNTGTSRSYRIKIPEGWKQLVREWKPKNGYYFQFPSTDIYDSYNWPSGYTGNPYLILTNAKILNPERGYSASENTERRYITAYLYNNIINNPQKFINEADRYNVSGIILEKDTIYNNYKYAFAAIESKFKDFETFSNDNANIYEVGPANNSLVTLYNNSDIIKVKNAQLNYYHLIRSVTPSSRLIQIDENSASDLFTFEPLQGSTQTSVKYALPKDVTNKYDIFVYGNSDNVTEAKIDGKSAILAKSSGYYSIHVEPDSTCCQYLEVFVKGSLISGGSFPLTWSKQPVFVPNISTMVPVSDGLLRVNEKEVYLAPLPIFDPSRISHLQVSFKGNYNFPFGMSLIQADNDSLSTRYIGNYRVQDPTKPINIIYDGFVNPVSSVFKDSTYYIGVYGMKLLDEKQQKVDYPKDIVYKASPGLVINENFPMVFAVSSPKQDTSPREINVTTVQNNKSLIPVELPEIDLSNTVLQFKNSFSKEWKLVPTNRSLYESLSKRDPSTLEKLSLYIKAKSAEAPSNGEYYSNIWKLHNSNDRYFVLVFWPTLLQELCFAFSFVLLVALSIYISVRRK